MQVRRFVLALLVVLAPAALAAPITAPRTIRQFTDGWRFIQADPDGA